MWSSGWCKIDVEIYFAGQNIILVLDRFSNIEEKLTRLKDGADRTKNQCPKRKMKEKELCKLSVNGVDDEQIETYL